MDAAKRKSGKKKSSALEAAAGLLISLCGLG